MRCDEAATTLTELAEGAAPSSDAAARHIGRCLRCQAQLAQHRRVRRSMTALRARTVEPAPGLLAEILAALDAMGEPDTRPGWRRHLLAYALAGTAAGAATAAGAVVLVARSRRTPRLAPAS